MDFLSANSEDEGAWGEVKSEATIQQFRHLKEQTERTRFMQLVFVMMSNLHIVDALFTEKAIHEKVEAVLADPEAHEFEEVDRYSLECLRDELVHLEAHWLGVLDSDAV